MESMGKHPVLISQKFLLTLYKKNITKSRKKRNKPRVSKTAALGEGSRHLEAGKWVPPHTWGMVEGLGPRGLYPSLPSP